MNSTSSCLMGYCKLGIEFILLKNSRAEYFISFFSLSLSFLFAHSLKRLHINYGWQWGPGLKDRVFTPTSHDFILPHPHPALHDRENFLAPSLALRAPRSPAPLGKILLLVNLPTTITIVFNKTCFVNKNILKINNKFIPSNQTNFWKKLNNIIKVFNKTISQ